MVICQKCKKEISIWNSYPQKGGYSLCKDCREETKDNPKLLNRLRMESGRNLELKDKTETIKQSKKITQVGKDNLVVKVKRERRSIIATIFMIIIGLILVISGIIGIIISFPLMFVIIGFFSAIGSAGIVALGVLSLKLSLYKSKDVACPNCREVERVHVNVIGSAFTCKRCQKRVLVEYLP